MEVITESCEQVSPLRNMSDSLIFFLDAFFIIGMLGEIFANT